MNQKMQLLCRRVEDLADYLDDRFGKTGDLAARTRLLRESLQAVRAPAEPSMDETDWSRLKRLANVTKNSELGESLEKLFACLRNEPAG